MFVTSSWLLTTRKTFVLQHQTATLRKIRKLQNAFGDKW